MGHDDRIMVAGVDSSTSHKGTALPLPKSVSRWVGAARRAASGGPLFEHRRGGQRPGQRPLTRPRRQRHLESVGLIGLSPAARQAGRLLTRSGGRQVRRAPTMRSPAEPLGPVRPQVAGGEILNTSTARPAPALVRLEPHRPGFLHTTRRDLVDRRERHPPGTRPQAPAAGDQHPHRPSWCRHKRHGTGPAAVSSAPRGVPLSDTGGEQLWERARRAALTSAQAGHTAGAPPTI